MAQPSSFRSLPYHLHWPLILLTLVLSCIGLLMMLSAGSGEARLYFTPHAIRLCIGLALMLTLAAVPMHLLFKYAYALYGFGIVTLIAVDIIGHIGMGAQRWVKFGGMNIQPSEFFKLAAILALARYFHSLHADDVKRFAYLIPPLVMLAIPAVLILRQPNLGTTVIVLSVGGIMCFLAGVRYRYFIIAIGGVLAAAPLAWQFMHDYQKRRVLTFLDPSQDPLGAGYNILQSMIAIGSGGLFGKGYMQGSQGQLNFLPEKHTDFIFTMFAEEWGFVGGITLLGLYAMLLAFMLMIAVRSRNQFGSLIASGVAAMIFMHLFINIAMVMGMLPVVGLPLPFLSYGGSIMFSTLLGMGLVLNAHRHSDVQTPQIHVRL